MVEMVAATLNIKKVEFIRNQSHSKTDCDCIPNILTLKV
jgi:hypothetical protein